MKTPITIRLSDSAVVMSYDDGRSAVLDDVDSVKRFVEYVDEMTNGKTFEYGYATVAMIATIGESALIRPLDAGCVNATTRTLPLGDAVNIGSITLDDSLPLKTILERRRSEQRFDDVSLGELATVLVRSGRVVSWEYAPDGTQITFRPTPSAGARHPIELMVLAINVDGLASGIWRFEPFSCNLHRCEDNHTQLNKVISAIREAGRFENDPAAVIFLVADFVKTLCRYPNGASLVWRDAGVLAGTLHLCAGELQLASKIVGTCQILNKDLLENSVDICAVALGRRKELQDLHRESVRGTSSLESS